VPESPIKNNKTTNCEQNDKIYHKV
jgi:hypothetical protein